MDVSQLTRYALMDDGLEPERDGAFVKMADVASLAAGANDAIDAWEVLANKLHATNRDLLDAAKHTLKVLGTGEDHPSCLVTHLQEVTAKAEGVTDE